MIFSGHCQRQLENNLVMLTQQRCGKYQTHARPNKQGRETINKQQKLLERNWITETLAVALESL